MVKDYPKQGDVFFVDLDPTVGAEIKKKRPCVIVSNNTQNKFDSNVIVVPITSTIKLNASITPRVKIKEKEGCAVCPQIRSIDKQRLLSKVSHLTSSELQEIKKALILILDL